MVEFSYPVLIRKLVKKQNTSDKREPSDTEIFATYFNAGSDVIQLYLWQIDANRVKYITHCDMQTSSDDYRRLLILYYVYLFVVLICTDNAYNNNFNPTIERRVGYGGKIPLPTNPLSIWQTGLHAIDLVLHCPAHVNTNHVYTTSVCGTVARGGGGDAKLITVRTTFNGKLMYPYLDTFAKPDISMATNTAIILYTNTVMTRMIYCDNSGMCVYHYSSCSIGRILRMYATRHCRGYRTEWREDNSLKNI